MGSRIFECSRASRSLRRSPPRATALRAAARSYPPDRPDRGVRAREQGGKVLWSSRSKGREDDRTRPTKPVVRDPQIPACVVLRQERLDAATAFPIERRGDHLAAAAALRLAGLELEIWLLAAPAARPCSRDRSDDVPNPKPA